MVKGIDLSIAADTRSATSAINRGLIDPLEDVSELLETVGKEGESATEQLETGMRNAQRRTNDASDEIRKLRDDLNKAGRQGKDTGDEIRDGFRRAEEGAEEFKDEANSTAREAAASFDGSAESIVDAFQEVTANAFVGFGPAGAAAGLVAAGGIGLVVAAFEQAETARKALEDRANGLAQAYIAAGTTILDTITLASRVSEVLTTPEQRNEAQKLADVLGIELPEAARILAGDTNALAGAQEVLAQKQADLNDQQRDGKLLTEEEATAYGDQSIALSNAADALGVYATNNDTASQSARNYSEALLGMINDAGTAAVEVDELGNRLVTLPDETQVLISAETGQATTDISAFKGDYDGKVDQMNSRDVVLQARASVDEAQRIVNNFITQNNGKSFRLNGRVTVDNGTDWD